MKMNIDLIKKMKNAIYSKPLKSCNQFYTINKNYNNMLINLLDDNKLNTDKNIMISELDIKLNNSQSENYDQIEEIDKKNIISNYPNNETQVEFKKQLTENIIKYLQKNEKNDISNNIEYKNKNKKNIMLKSKKALNLTAITPLNKRFNTININRNNDKQIFKKKYFIKIDNKINTYGKKPIIINKNKKEFFLKKPKNKNIKLFLEKINSSIFNQKKNNNTIINHPRKSLLLTNAKINTKNKPTINDNKKIKSINLKFNKNTSFKEKINNSNILRSSFKKEKAKREQLKNFIIFNSNSKPKKNLLSNNKLISLSNGKNILTEDNFNYNNFKNISTKNNNDNDNNFIKKKIIHNKYRNLTIKEINFLNNNFNLNFLRSNYSSFLNNNYNKEKAKNFSTIENEKKIIISPLYKKLKIHINKNLHNLFNKNPINIVNININRNNNFIMNINNDNYINSINNNNNKIINSSSKIEGKMKKFYSFQDFSNFNENYKSNIMRRFSKERKRQTILEKKNFPFFKKFDINKTKKIN